MALSDRFGLPLTAASPVAVEDYVAAVDLILSANTGAEALLDRALAADPDFALAHIARADALVRGQAQGYVEGSKVDVHYDPANPGSAVLECRVRGLWLLWLCSAGFLGGAAWLVGFI